MSAARPILKLFVDQCVPDSAGAAFREGGHEVVLLRERIAPNSPDPLVAAVSEAAGAILVTHDTDFDQLAKRAGVGRRRFKNLSRIGLRCRPSQAANRISACMSLIEHEWTYCQSGSDRRLFMDISDGVIRIIR